MMATIASLVVEISANARRFNSAIQDITSRAKRFAKQLKSIIGVTVKAVVAGAVAAAGAVTAIVTTTSLAMRDLVRDSEAVGTSARDLQKWQVAAQGMGIEAETVTDIMKDVNEKIGDFVRTGGGEAADVFEQLGLSAQGFIGLAPDKALLRISSALDGLSVGEKTFFMESLANDASRLIPLLDDNASRFNELVAEGERWGNIMTASEIKASAALGSTLGKAKKMIFGFKNLLGAQLAPAFNEIIAWVNELTASFGGPRDAAKAVAGAIINSMALSIEGVSELIKWINKLRVSLMKVQRIELAAESAGSQVRSLVTGEGQTEEQSRLKEFDAEIKRLQSGETGADAVIAKLRDLAGRISSTSGNDIPKLGDSAVNAATNVGMLANSVRGAATSIVESARAAAIGVIPTNDQSSVPGVASAPRAGLGLSSITPMSQAEVRASQPAGFGASAQSAVGQQKSRKLGTLTLAGENGGKIDVEANASALESFVANLLSSTASAV